MAILLILLALLFFFIGWGALLATLFYLLYHAWFWSPLEWLWVLRGGVVFLLGLITANRLIWFQVKCFPTPSDRLETIRRRYQL